MEVGRGGGRKETEHSTFTITEQNSEKTNRQGEHGTGRGPNLLLLHWRCAAVLLLSTTALPFIIIGGNWLLAAVLMPAECAPQPTDHQSVIQQKLVHLLFVHLKTEPRHQ